MKTRSFQKPIIIKHKNPEDVSLFKKKENVQDVKTVIFKTKLLLGSTKSNIYEVAYPIQEDWKF